MNDASFFRQGADEIVAANRTMASTQADLDAAYARWQELE
jgi:ATP-binding cassette subfamily F protein uup